MRTLAVACLVAALLAPAAAAAEHRYGVRAVLVDGHYVDGQFYDRLTGERFVPRGNTYLRRGPRHMGGGHVISHQQTLDVGIYDAAAADAALAAMGAQGSNVVNVIVAGDEPPWGTTWNRHVGAPFDGFNAWYLTTRGVEGFSAFWAGFARGLIELRAPLDAVFAYELGGETWFQPERAPLSWTRGHVTTANDAAAGLQTLQRESCAWGFDDWLLWTWDTPTPVWPQMWSAVSADGYLAHALGPRTRPNACA